MTDIQNENTIVTPSSVEKNASAFFTEETKSRFYERKLPEVRVWWIWFVINL